MFVIVPNILQTLDICIFFVARLHTHRILKQLWNRATSLLFLRVKQWYFYSDKEFVLIEYGFYFDEHNLQKDFLILQNADRN